MKFIVRAKLYVCTCRFNLFSKTPVRVFDLVVLGSTHYATKNLKIHLSCFCPSFFLEIAFHNFFPAMEKRIQRRPRKDSCFYRCFYEEPAYYFWFIYFVLNFNNWSRCIYRLVCITSINICLFIWSNFRLTTLRFLQLPLLRIYFRPRLPWFYAGHWQRFWYCFSLFFS